MDIQRQRPLSTHSLATTDLSHSSDRSAAPQYEEIHDVIPGPVPTPFPVDELEDCDARSDASDETVHFRVSCTPDHVSRLLEDITEINLVGIQRACVEALERILPPLQAQTAVESDRNQKLAAALGELLEASYELETFYPSSACCSPVTPPSVEDDESPLFHLVHVLLAAQTAFAQREQRNLCPPSPPEPVRQTSDTRADLHPTVTAFREEIAWARVESLSMAVIQLIREREPRIQSMTEHALPPEYKRVERNSVDSASSQDSRPPSYTDHCDDNVIPPDHVVASTNALGDVKGMPQSPQDKQRLPILADLDTVTSAIERLHHLAPQLENQRTALRTMPAGLRASSSRRDGRMQELESIWDKIEAAHGPSRYRGVDKDTEARERRKLKHPQTGLHAELKETASQLRSLQTDNSPEANIARARELREREEFLMDLFDSSRSARLEDQEVPLRTKEERDESGATERPLRSDVDPLNERIPFETFLAEGPSTFQTTQAFQHDNLFDEGESSSLSSSIGRKAPLTAPKPTRSKRQHFLHVLSRSASFSRLNLVPEVRPPLPTPEPPAEYNPYTPGKPFGLPEEDDVFQYTPGKPFGLPEEDDVFRATASNSSLFSRKMTSGASVPSKIKLVPKTRIDVDTLGYVCEHQENLNQVTVAVYGTPHPSEFALDVVTTGEALVTSKTDSSLRLNVTLPTSVPLGQVASLLPREGFSEGRINALPTPSSALTLSTVITHALSAPHLRQLAPRALCCTSCDREIAEFPSDIEFKDLPSEHWAEMLEAWMCHSDPAFTAHIAKQTKDGFWPTSNTVLIGGSYILVAGSDICESKLRLSEPTSSEDANWRIVSCPCSEVLGKQRVTGPGSGTIRFAKWAISLIHGGAGPIEHVRFPVQVFVVSDMLELSQAHASHRFVISDGATGELRLALWLFNPSMKIAYRKPMGSPSPRRPPSRERALSRSPRSGSTSPRSTGSHSIPDPARSFRAAKIMYRVLDGGGYEHLPGFRGQVEQLAYSAEVCSRLQTALQNSSTVYPPVMRGFSAFDCGFLERV